MSAPSLPLPRLRLVRLGLFVALLIASAAFSAQFAASAFAQQPVLNDGEYRLTSNLDPASGYLRVFGVDVVGLGSAGDPRTTWTLESDSTGNVRLRNGDLYLTRQGDDDGTGGFTPGRFLDLLGDRPESLSQLWTIEEDADGAYRIVSAWGPDGYLTRDTVPLDDGTTEATDSVSLYGSQDWSSQRWTFDQVAPEQPTPTPEPTVIPTTPPVPTAPPVPTTAPAAVDLVVPSPDQPVVVRATCLGPNGRIDVLVLNTRPTPTTFQIRIGDLSSRSLTLDVGNTGTTIATGRPDGDLTVLVDVDGDEVHSETLPIACDPTDREVAVIVSCLAGNGRIDTYLTNSSGKAATYTVLVDYLAPRQRTVAPGETLTVSVTGRHDAEWPIIVARDATQIHEETVTVSCDGVELPSPAPSPTSEPAVSTIVWDNRLIPPALDDPIIVDSSEALRPFIAEWPAYDIFCGGLLYEVDMRSEDRDVLVDLRGEPALTIPLLIYGNRNVVLLGAEFDIEVQPGCEPGMLATQPVEGGPFVGGLSLHPRLPAGGALRIANPLTAWIEGAFIKMNGIEGDCMIANNGTTQSQEQALQERDWIVVNSRCDGQEGASPEDLGGDGVHGDFVHFQSDAMFRDLLFENIVHLSGQNGVTANQSTPDGRGSGEIFVRNYYFDYDPEWRTHGPDSPSGGVGFSILIDDPAKITVDNYHYRNVHDSCAGMVITFDDAPLRIGDPTTNCEPNDGFNIIAGSPTDPLGNPSPIAEFLFAPADAVGAAYTSPFAYAE